jgi:hypothetical protein
MKAVRLAVNNVIKNINRRSSQAKANKSSNRPADGKRDGNLLPKYQGRKHKHVFGPVVRTHYLQKFHTTAFRRLFVRTIFNFHKIEIPFIRRRQLIENIDIRADRA